MAIWVLSPRLGTCCACRPAVCDSCVEVLPCTFNEFDSGIQTALPYARTYGVTGQFTIAHNITVEVDFSGASSTRLVIKANGVSVYDSGCQDEGFFSSTVTIPAGTTSIEVTITFCDSDLLEWEYSIYC